jgi:hypothetical protein
METKIIYREPLGNPERKYRQDKFIISSCRAWGAGPEENADDMRACIKLCKEIGCNLTEYIWANPQMTEECIMACEEFGIDGIFQNWNAFGGFQAAKGEMKINMEELKKFMEFGHKYKHFRGYTVWDEPFSDSAVKAAAEQLNTIEEMDPDCLPYTVAIPSYNARDTWENGKFEYYLIRYANTINPVVMALDYYPFSATRQDPYDQIDSSNLWLDIALLRKLGLEKKTPMWFCIQTQDSPFGEIYWRFSPAKMTMQMYNVLLHGGKGVQIYSTVEGAMYNDGRKGPLYYQMKDMNRRVHQWGKTLMALDSEHVFHSPEVLKDNKNFDKYREALSDSQILADEELPFRCSVGELADKEGNRYLIILNRDYDNARKFKLNFKKSFRIYDISEYDGMQSVRSKSAKSLTLELAPGDAVFLRFQDAKEKAYFIDYVLKK